MSTSPKDQPSPQPDITEKADSTKQVEDEQASAAENEENSNDAENESKSEESKSEAKEEQSDDASELNRILIPLDVQPQADPPLPDEPVPPQTEWQAVWSPAHNAYYFFNSRTSETTWINPLDPSASTPAAQPTPTPEPAPTEPTGEAPPPDFSHLGGIDPELAYLDPTLAVPSAGAKGPVPTFSARFGARDGKFTAMDGRRPEHLSEAARAQRMSAVYYDTEAWEREIAERDAKAKAEEEAGAGDKRKRVTKADIERFKAQKKAKQAMRNAWLRE